MSAESTPVNVNSTFPATSNSLVHSAEIESQNVKPAGKTAAEIVAQGRPGCRSASKSKVSDNSKLDVTSVAESSNENSTSSQPENAAKTTVSNEVKPVMKQTVAVTSSSPMIPQTASENVSSNKVVIEKKPSLLSKPPASKDHNSANVVKPSKPPSIANKTETKSDIRQPLKAHHSQSLTNTGGNSAVEKPVVASKSDSAHNDDSARPEKAAIKSSKTFDKESFVEAPLPSTNPWKKPTPVETIKPLPQQSEQPITDTKKTGSDAPSDKRKSTNIGNQRGPPPRSPRGAKYRSHPSSHRGDRHRKPLVNSKSTPVSSSQSNQSVSGMTIYRSCPLRFEFMHM